MAKNPSNVDSRRHGAMRDQPQTFNPKSPPGGNQILIPAGLLTKRPTETIQRGTEGKIGETK
jgi:hypothetical protein